MRIFAASAAVTSCVLACFVGPVAVSSAAVPAVHVMGTHPVDSYKKAIHESVRVQTSMDTDHNGVPDTIAVDIIRPSEPAAQGQRIPVIMDASPYYSCCGRGNEYQVKTYRSNGVIASLPLYYDNYFVPRGYAVVDVDMLGTSRSTGCDDYGGPDDIASITAVIDWLNGRAQATDLHGNPVTADWANGSVGLIGKSYDGSLANGVAATGVQGLKTIVPISAIDSWYNYSREDGVVRSPDYVLSLLETVGNNSSACGASWRALNQQADDNTGAYNHFWHQRDYLANVKHVHASVFESHGVNDDNVETDNLSTWWAALSARNVPRKLWLSQEGHVDPFDYRRGAWVAELHRWFDYWLMGIDNGVMDEPQVTVERSPNQFVDENSWPAGTGQQLPLGDTTLGTPANGKLSVTDNPNLTEQQILANPDGNLAGRLMFRTGVLAADVRVSGSPTLTLRIKADKTDTPITAKLIDYGTASRPVGEGVENGQGRSCWGESSSEDSACYLNVVHDFTSQNASVISRGWTDAALANDLKTPDPLQPGHWRTLTIPLHAQDDTIAAGHRLGLAITLSDTEFTDPHSTGATVTLDLSACVLTVPDVGTFAA